MRVAPFGTVAGVLVAGAVATGFVVFGAGVLLAAAGEAPNQQAITISESAEGLFLEGPRWRVGLRDGVVVALENKVVGESVALPSTGGVPALPAGLGVQTGAVDAARELHGVWRHVPMGARLTAGERYPSQHRPGPNSQLDVRRVEDGGVDLTYRGLVAGQQTFPKEKYGLEARADPVSGDLLLRASGSSPSAGVYGVSVAISNITSDTSAHIAHFGGARFDRAWPIGEYSIQDRGPFWEAPVVVLQGRFGACAIWAEDPEFSPKGLFWTNDGHAFHVVLESRNLAPYESYTTARSVTWHLNCDSGSWVNAASHYRDWFRRTFASQLAQRTPAWAKSVRVVLEGLEMSAEDMDRLAKSIEPSKVLLHSWNARIPDFGRDLPDFTPRPDFIDAVRRARAHGFRTSAYVNTYCFNKGSPVFLRDGLAQFVLVRNPPFVAERKVLADFEDGRLLYGDPLSEQWRAYHARSMAEFVKQTSVDVLYEDTAGASGDYGNGVVGGWQAGGGSYEALRELRDAVPGTALATELDTEPIAPFSTWPLRANYRWGSKEFRESLSQHASPFEAYLFGPDVLGWTQVGPTGEGTAFHQAVDYADAMGGLAWILGPAWLDGKRGDQGLEAVRARIFSERQLKPIFPAEPWPDRVRAYYEDEQGGRYQIVEDRGQALIGPDGHELYRRTRQVSRLQTELAIVGWPAYDASGPIGLDPAMRYSARPGARGDTRLRMTSLSRGAFVKTYREGDGFVLVTLDRPLGTGDEKIGLTYSAPRSDPTRDSHRVPSRACGGARCLSVPRGSTLIWFDSSLPTLADRESGGSMSERGELVEKGSGLTLDPTRQPLSWSLGKHGMQARVFSPTAGAQLVFDYAVKVPRPAGVVRMFGWSKAPKRGDGVTVSVLVNGRAVSAVPIPSNDDTEHQWDVPLTQFAGRPVLLTIAVDPNGDTNSDSLYISRPRLVDDTAVARPTHRVVRTEG